MLRELFLPYKSPSWPAPGASNAGPAGRPVTNSHIHLPPNFSAFPGIEAAVEAADAEGISLLGVSNYYDFSVYLPFARLCLERGIAPVFGMEMIAFDEDMARQGIRANDPKNPGKIYLCAKGMRGFEAPTARARELLDLIRSRDEERSRTMLSLACAHLRRLGMDAELTADTLKASLAQRLAMPLEWIVLQERHVAQGIHEALAAHPAGGGLLELLLPGHSPSWPASKVQDGLRSALLKVGGPAYVEERFITVAEALELIREMDAEPVYPVLGDAVPGFTEFERDFEALFARLEAWGIRRLEWIPTRNTEAYLREHVQAAIARGWAVTAGTEHNTAVMEPVRPACAGGAPLPADLQPHFTTGLLSLLGRQSAGWFDMAPGTLSQATECDFGRSLAARIRAVAHREGN